MQQLKPVIPWGVLSTLLYNDKGIPVAIQIKRKESKKPGFYYMVPKNSEDYDEIKSMALAVFFEDMMLELRKQVIGYVLSVYLEPGQTYQQLQDVVLYKLKAPEALYLYKRAVTLTHEFTSEDKKTKYTVSVSIPKQIAGEKALAYSAMREKLISYKYITKGVEYVPEPVEQKSAWYKEND